MNWRNVRLIWARETRDQLRDRRMLFMICVLPLLLYPLLGTSFMQLSQFMRQHEATVWVFGAEQLLSDSELPPLIENGQFDPNLFEVSSDSEKLRVEIRPTNGLSEAELIENARRELLAGTIDAVAIFPEDFVERLQDTRERLSQSKTRLEEPANAEEVPRPLSLYDSPREASRIAHNRLDRLIDCWHAKIVQQNLLESGIPLNITQPFQLNSVDVAGRQQQQAALYSKLLPFIVFLWALTGAFYPAVDLCAGEKERGTLEALLVSPARRSEIVWGKLLTVMLFSVFTAILNLASMGFTAAFVAKQLSSALPSSASMFSLPPFVSLMWILLALVPIAALFSALSLACSAFARSTKEGQYYFMPLFMITLPLMLVPLSPGSEINLGNSLIPITGLSFLLRELMEGDYARVLPFAVPVILVTLGCCWLAVRWAIELFNQETVLFRENERFELRAWIVHMVRDRKATPSVGMALACVALIFFIQFFARMAMAGSTAGVSYDSLVRMVTISMLCVLVPPLLMTFLFTGNPKQTLLVSGWPRFSAMFVAGLLAVVYFPLGLQVGAWIHQLYPIDSKSIGDPSELAELFTSAPSLWSTLLLLAAVPAVCEELAFRGFILSGLRHLGHKWWAILLTAVLFGMAHTALLQQSIAATATGVIIGYIAVQSGHLAPCIIFHFAYNGLAFTMPRWGEWLGELSKSTPGFDRVFQSSAAQFPLFSPAVVFTSGICSMVLLWWFHRLDSPQTAEERLTEARLQPVQRPFVQDPT